MKHQRQLDASAWLEEVAVDAKTKLSRTKIAGSEVKVHTSRPCPSAAFVAMHDSFAAQAAEHEMVVDEAVTPVASLKRGGRPVDVFSVFHDQLINDYLGPDVTVHHALTNGAIVKLVAPFDFYLQAKKDPLSGELLHAKQLMVKAHMVALVPNHTHPSMPVFLVDTENFDYADGAVEVYQCTLANAILGMVGSAVPKPLRKWAAAVVATQ